MKNKLGVFWIITVSALGLLLASVNASAQGPRFIPEGREIDLLPPYCAAKMKDVNSSYWQEKLGPKNFVHIHHLCFALYAKNKAISTFDKKDRQYLLQRAIGNFEYIESHVEPDFILLVIVYIEKADVYRLLDMYAKAEEYYLKAIRFNPDYAKAYASYSQYFVYRNDYAKAEEVLMNGLKMIPDSRSLNRRLKRLKKKIK